MTGVDGPFLAIDSSSSMGSVAVGGPDGILAELSLNVKAGHSSALLPAIDHVLRSARLAPSDLVGVVVGAGPGSFTGLRIAGATAKGIAHARRIPLFAYSSLLVAAVQGWGAEGPVCALFDARGRDVYAACYRFGARIETLLPPTALTLDEVVEKLRGEQHVVWVGDGAVRHRAELVDRTEGRVGAVHFATPRASSLLWLMAAQPGSAVDAAAWQPEYLRASGAERIAAARKLDAASP